MARLIDADQADVDSIRCYYGNQCYLEDVQEWIDEQLTVDAVPVVHGRWELVEYQTSPFGVDQEYQCSICGIPADYENITRYCPNCGAKMDGGVEDG